MIELLAPQSTPAPARSPRAEGWVQAARRKADPWARPDPGNPEADDPDWDDADRPAPPLGFVLLLSLMLWLVLGLILAWLIF